MSLVMHPGLFLILVGAIAAIVPQSVRKFVLAAGPALALAMFFTLPHEEDLLVIPFINDWSLHLLTIDSLSWFFNVFFLTLAFLGGVYSMHNPSWAEALASMTYAGSTVCMVFAGDWISLIFFWELMAISSLYLIWANHTARSRRAGFRYLLIHMLGGNLLLAGIFFKVIAGDMMVGNIAETRDAAFWLMFLAVCINGVIPPLHAWVADAYPESTITGGAFMSGLTTKAAIYVLIRMFAGTDFLIVVGVIMAIYGAVFAIMENDMRRLLSYHIVSQLGFMVAGVGMGSALALDGAAAHAISNILQKSLLFMCCGAIMYATGIRKINQLGGLARKMPWVLVFFLAAAFSISGVPLTNGFVCKTITIAAASELHLDWVYFGLSLASIGTFLSITLKMTYFIFIAKPDKEFEVGAIPKNMYWAMAISAFLNVIFGIVPAVLYQYLPFGSGAVYHPYTIDHVTQYIQVLVAAMIPFMLYLPHMKPHSVLSLDFDWFYRRPFASFVSGVSHVCCATRDALGKAWRELYELFGPMSANPMRFIGRFSGKDAPDQYDPEKYRAPIGESMLVDMTILLVLLFFFVII